tara:strand:- start:115 stop:714 length:600 start_codon:yes stop_codon:yes gene_type:complete
MTKSNVTSNGFSFAGIREAKKERTQKIESARRDQEYENYKAKELAKAQIRNSKIPTTQHFNFTDCIVELRGDINRTKKMVRETAWQYGKEDRDTIYNVQRDYDLQITFFDDNGRNESYNDYIDIVLSEITKKDLIDIKEKLVESAIKNPTDFKGIFGFCFDGRIDISTRDKKNAFVDYEIGEYIDCGYIWDSEKGWHNQ